jgi:hypothetical protein
MQEQKYKEMLGKLNGILGESSNEVFITKDTDVETLNNNQLLMTHVLLHKFYSTGNRELTKENIIDLHGKVSARIKHSHFDRLDEVDKNE